jgi:hypothetical protein
MAWMRSVHGFRGVSGRCASDASGWMNGVAGQSSLDLQDPGRDAYVPPMTRAYEELVDFIATGTTPQTVAGFRASPETRARVEELIAKEKGDGLLPEETAELNDYLQLEHLMRLAKARAKRVLEK